jgi:hypothetical protein
MPQKTRKDAGKGNHRGFYSKALQEAEKLEFDEAHRIQGVDDEIALLRLRLKELAKDQPQRIDLHLKAANTIARLVKIRYQTSKEQKNSLKEAIARVLTEVALPLGINVGMKKL